MEPATLLVASLLAVAPVPARDACGVPPRAAPDDALRTHAAGSPAAPAPRPAPPRRTGDGRWDELGPPSRLGAALVYDARCGRWLLLGGARGPNVAALSYADDVWAFDPARDRAWRPLATLGTPPPARAGHRAVYDAARDRVLVFGGARGAVGADGYAHFTYYGDVWALSLAGMPRWQQLSDSGGPPGGRSLPGVAWDAAGERLLVFGGFTADEHGPDGGGTFGSRADLWQFEPARRRWTRLDDGAAGPSPRNGGLLAVDAAGARLLLVGGSDVYLDSTGQQARPDRFDVWVRPLAGGAWSEIDAAGPHPADRIGDALAWDAPGRRAFVLGGRLTATVEDVADVWTLDAGTDSARWTSSTETPDGPPGLEDAAALVDDAQRSLVLTGGANGLGALADTWRSPLDAPTAWTRAGAPQDAGPARYGASAALDAAGDRCVVFGGERRTFGRPPFREVFGDLLALDLASGAWSPLAVKGPTPSGRGGCATAFDAGRRRLWIVGGISASGDAASEAWSLDLAGAPGWTDRSALAGGPGPLEDGLAVFDAASDRLVVFGRPLGAAQAGTWVLPGGGAAAWQPLAVTGAAPPAHGGSAAYDPLRRRMLVVGGREAGATEAGTWALSLAGPPAWTRLDAAAAPAPLVGSSAVFDAAGDRLIVFGGATGPFAPGTVTAQAWELRFGDGAPLAWHALAPLGGAPLPRLDAAAAWDAARGALVVALGWDAVAFPLPDAWRLEMGQAGPRAERGGGPAMVAPATPRAAVYAFRAPAAGGWTAELFDVRGRRVAEARGVARAAGEARAEFGGALAPGVYFARVRGAGVAVSGRVVVVR